MKKTVALHTLGCKLNYSETSTIGDQFLSKGFSIVDFKEKADIYVFNTCTVTENAEKECRQLVRRALRENPQAYVIVTGCYAQLRAEEIQKIDGVDAVLGSSEKFKIFSLLEDFEKKDFSCIHVTPTGELNDFGKASSSEGDDRTRAFFKVQDGCDYKCTFCTIPAARGKSRSLDSSYAIKEFQKLIDSGFKEIILTGVNVGDYGKSTDSSLYLLLKKLIKIDGDFRIRISSIEPNLLTDEIIDLVAENEKLCNHFHIPLQSGSADILRLMKRRYTVNDYHRVVHKVVSKVTDVCLGIDVIVGFPGETEQHFNETYNFLVDLPFSYLHVFTYSERPNTIAYNLEGKVDIGERKKRNNMLRILSDKKKYSFYRNMVGKELEVLFEKKDENGKMKGFSSNYVRVISPFNENLVNKISRVNLVSIEDGLGFGTVSEKKNSFELHST